jgi:hypothetical protein
VDQDQDLLIKHSLAQELLNYVTAMPTGPHAAGVAFQLIERLRSLRPVPKPEPPEEKTE